MASGRGKEVQFFATDDEICEMVLALPRELHPYSLVGQITEERAGEGSASRTPFANPPATIIESLAVAGGNQVWVASSRFGHDDVSQGLGPLAWSLSGLPVLQHGFRPKGRLECSRIAIVTHVRSRESGEIEKNSAYGAVFQAMRGFIQPRLHWASVRILRDGSEDEDDSLQLMTNAAATAAREFPDEWAARPGRRVDSRK
jgi:hypothetical protein